MIYLEGKTDPDIFFPLLGLVRPTGDIHQGSMWLGWVKQAEVQKSQPE